MNGTETSTPAWLAGKKVGLKPVNNESADCPYKTNTEECLQWHKGYCVGTEKLLQLIKDYGTENVKKFMEN